MRPASTLGRPTGERTGLPFRAGDPVPTREPAADPTTTDSAAPAATDPAHTSESDVERTPPANPAPTNSALTNAAATDGATGSGTTGSGTTGSDGSAGGGKATGAGSGDDELGDDELGDEADDGLEEFLEELQLWLEDEPAPTDPIDEWLRGTPLRIGVINVDSIVFETPDGRTLGPILLPEGLVDQVELGWRPRLTAARTGDTWHLRPTE